MSSSAVYQYPQSVRPQLSPHPCGRTFLGHKAEPPRRFLNPILAYCGTRSSHCGTRPAAVGLEQGLKVWGYNYRWHVVADRVGIHPRKRALSKSTESTRSRLMPCLLIELIFPGILEYFQDIFLDTRINTPHFLALVPKDSTVQGHD